MTLVSRKSTKILAAFLNRINNVYIYIYIYIYIYTYAHIYHIYRQIDTYI